MTIDVEESLLAEVDRCAAAESESRNTFITRAIEDRLRAVHGARVDAAFGEMADDPAYCRKLGQIEEEMAAASDAAWSVAEQVAEYARKANQRKGKKRRGAG